VRKRIERPEISTEERTPLVRGLLEIIEQLAEQVHGREEEIGRLKDEIAVLKGEKKGPRFKPSKLEEQAGKEQGERGGNGQARRKGARPRS
jgi:hypothetical protein